MKSTDDITWSATDTAVATAELGFSYDARPIVAGEPGAGTFLCSCGKAYCSCDMDNDYADIDAELAALGF